MAVDLADTFGLWLSSKHTGLAVLSPIAKVIFELTGDGSDSYAALYASDDDYMLSDGLGVGPSHIGLAEAATDSPTLAALALTLAFPRALAVAAKSENFERLPRTASVEVRVGVHGTWGDELACTFETSAYEPPTGNALLLQRRLDSKRGNSWDTGATAEAFARLDAIDVATQATAWKTARQETFEWLLAQRVPPMRAIGVAWCPEAKTPPRMGGVVRGSSPFRAPTRVDLSWWLPLPSSEELREDDHIRFRYTTEMKLAEIAATAMESLHDDCSFRALPVEEFFNMYTRNRTAGGPGIFWSRG